MVDYVKELGAGSGLDTQAMITAMVAAEKSGPQAAIDRRTEAVTADISAMAQVKSALQNLQIAFQSLDDKNDFNFSSINNSGTSYVNATLDGNIAQSGSYNLKVDSIAQSEMRESVEFSSKTDDLNSGAAVSFTIQVGSGTIHTINLAAGDVSLESAAEEINDLEIGVSAWVVQTDEGAYKLLTQGPTGADNTVTVEDTNNLFGLNQTSSLVQTATDASLDMNGVTIVRDTNTLDDVIPGVSIDLLSTSVQSFNLSVSRDTESAQTTIMNLVDVVNAFDDIIEEATAVTASDGEPGALKDDAAIKAIRQTIRDFFLEDSSTPGTNLSSALDIGISIEQDGTFSVDSVALATALKDNFDDVAKIFSANTNDQSIYGTASRGIAGDVVKQIDDWMNSTGLITTRENTYTNLQSTLSDDQAALDERMLMVEERYTRQFSTMNKIMDEMKSMQEYLEGQLESLPFTADS